MTDLATQGICVSQSTAPSGYFGDLTTNSPYGKLTVFSEDNGAVEEMQVNALKGSMSPLLELPSEIRNQIWELVFKNHLVVPNGSRRKLRHVGCLACLKNDHGNPKAWSEVFLPVLTCRQIYNEAIQILRGSLNLHLNEGIFDLLGPTPPYPKINNQVRSLTVWIHIDEDNRLQWAELFKWMCNAFPNLHDLTLHAHMRPPDSYEKLTDVITLATPMVRYTRDKPNMPVTLTFDYTYEDIMFVSPYLGEIKTTDALEEHELVLRDLLADAAFIKAALADEEDEQAMVAALLRTARAHEQSWFEKLHRRNTTRLRELAEILRASERETAAGQLS